MKKIIIILLCASLLFVSFFHAKDSTVGNALFIPPLLQPEIKDGKKIFSLNAGRSENQILEGRTTQTLSYNGLPMLGPTIVAYKGDNVQIDVTNSLSEITTAHWHGMHLDSDNDGNMFQQIAPHDTWAAKFTIEQDAGINWFHPHAMDITAEQVYQGLAGLFIIKDAEEDALNLPETYGVDDIPIVFQGREFDRKNQLDFGHHTMMHGNSERGPRMMRHRKGRMYDRMAARMFNGQVGDVVLVNAQRQPVFNVTTNLVRLRILNGGNAGFYNLKLSDGTPLNVIASDQGLLPQRIAQQSLESDPASRYDVILDLSDKKIGDSIDLIGLEETQGNRQVLMTFKIKAQKDNGTLSDIPLQLTPTLETVAIDDLVIDREIVLATIGSGHYLNNERFNPNKILFDDIKQGQTEIWKISNKSDVSTIAHNFHLHGVKFRILSFDGKAPTAVNAAYKDTVALPHKGDYAIIQVTFNYPGIFPFHCHVLEHEDGGMMGLLNVI